MKTLDDARLEINEIDEQMAQLFEKRMELAKDVALYKKANSLPIFDAKREKEVIKRNVERIKNDIYKPYYEEYIQSLMDISKSYQRTFIEKLNIAYQGSVGAFSYLAAVHLFKEEKLNAYPTFEAVFKAIDSGEAECGIIPFENSYTGDVNETLDLLYKYPNIYINQMYDLAVKQNLVGIKGSSLDDIKDVYSHPQALSQSTLFLKGMNVNTHEYQNTALAAKYVSECNDKTKAAIASIETASAYGLEILSENINDSQNNITRFMIIKKSLNRNNGNRFSLMFSLDHKAGSLADIMVIFKKFGYNLENIKSRSTRKGTFQYYFYVELVGSLKNSNKLIEVLEEKVYNLRIVGTYSL